MSFITPFLIALFLGCAVGCFGQAYTGPMVTCNALNKQFSIIQTEESGGSVYHPAVLQLTDDGRVEIVTDLCNNQSTATTTFAFTDNAAVRGRWSS
jgi:hypothetical protein